MRIRFCLTVGTLILLLITVAALIGITAENQNREREHAATVSAIFATNSVVASMIDYCGHICRATGYTVGCSNRAGDCGRVFTATPTPTDPSLPTMSQDEMTSTAIQRTNAAIRTVRAV